MKSCASKHPRRKMSRMALSRRVPMSYRSASSSHPAHHHASSRRRRPKRQENRFNDNYLPDGLGLRYGEVGGSCSRLPNRRMPFPCKGRCNRQPSTVRSLRRLRRKPTTTTIHECPCHRNEEVDNRNMITRGLLTQHIRMRKSELGLVGMAVPKNNAGVP